MSLPAVAEHRHRRRHRRMLVGVLSAVCVAAVLLLALIVRGPLTTTGQPPAPPVTDGLATPGPLPLPPRPLPALPGPGDRPCAAAEDGNVVARPFTVPEQPPSDPGPSEEREAFPGLQVCPGT